MGAKTTSKRPAPATRLSRDACLFRMAAARADVDECLRLRPDESPHPKSALALFWEALEELIAMYGLSKLERQFRIAFFEARAGYWERNYEDWQLLRKSAPIKELNKLSRNLSATLTHLNNPQIRNGLEIARQRYHDRSDPMFRSGMYQHVTLHAASDIPGICRSLRGLDLLIAAAKATGARTLHDRRDDKEVVRNRIRRFWNEDGGDLLGQRHRSSKTELDALIKAVLRLVDPKSNPEIE